MADQDTLLRALRAFAHAMAGSYDLTEMAYGVSDHITEALGAAGAGVSVADDEEALRFVTATSEDIVEIEREQERTQDGPCVHSYRTGEPVTVADVGSDSRWPEYSKTATELGVHAVIGFPLAVNGEPIGSIDVYNSAPREWSDSDLDVLGVFADMATAYLLRISELSEARDLAAQLQHALDSRILIEQAKGVLAGEVGITMGEAFRRLRSHARDHNLKLRAVSEAVLNEGLRPGTE